MTHLRLILIGTSGLAGFNEALAFASETADLEASSVPVAVKHLANRINRALGNRTIPIKGQSKSWSKYDFTAQNSKREVLFFNVCLSTTSSLKYNSLYSLEFLSRLLRHCTDITILDLRMAKTVHKDDLKAVPMDALVRHSTVPSSLKTLLDAFTEAQKAFQGHIQELEQFYQNSHHSKQFSLDVLKKASTDAFEATQKNRLRQINEKLVNFAQILPETDPLKRLLNETIEQDLIALFSGAYQTDARYRLKILANRRHRYARIGNPGETSYSTLDDTAVCKTLRELNRDNVIGRLYRKEEVAACERTLEASELLSEEEDNEVDSFLTKGVQRALTIN